MACSVSSEQSPEPSASSEAATTSTEPSAGASADPSPVATPSPTDDPTPDPTPSIAPPAFAWRRHVLPGLAYDSVLSHGGRFLATGPASGDDQDEFSVLSSDDGLTWRTLARRPFDGQFPLSMTSVDRRLIVIARRYLAPESFEDVVWRSDDGRSWDIWMDPHGALHPQASRASATVG